MSNIARQPVKSSNLKEVGYDPGTQILEVKFQSGKIYRYREVPESVYQGLMQSDSLGRFFHRSIRTSFPFEEVLENVVLDVYQKIFR